MCAGSGRGKVLGKSHRIFGVIFEQRIRKQRRPPRSACFAAACVQRMEQRSAGIPRQVSLRSLTAFFLSLRDKETLGASPLKPRPGPEPTAASGGNRQAERRKSQGVPLAARLCEFPGSPDPFLASRGFKPFPRCPRRRYGRRPCQTAPAGCRSWTGARAYPPGSRRCRTPRW